MTATASVYQEWVDGYVTPMQAIRSLCMELGEVESDLAPLQEQREQLRVQIGEVLARVGEPKVTIKGFGALSLTGPSITQKYDTRMIDAIIDELTEAGNTELAQKLAACKGKSMRAGGLRIERERPARE